MISKTRISMIRLAERLGKNPIYAEQIGVTVQFRNIDDTKTLAKRVKNDNKQN